MKNKNNPKEKPEGRKDQPSGRQASEQPEHTGNAPSSLHQGQGPDFPTQDPTASQQNKGVQDMNKNIGFKPPSEKNQKDEKESDSKSNPYEDPDHPKPDEKPYIGDDPEEIRRKSPKMD